MSTNVVRVAFPKRGGYAVADEVMNDLRLRIYPYPVADVAKAMGVSPACVYAIRAGRTKWPRPKTFFALLDFLGLELMIWDTDARKFL